MNRIHDTKKLPLAILALLIVSSAFPTLNFIAPPTVMVYGADPDFTVTIQIDDGVTVESMWFADHVNDLNSGNWIVLSGGTSVALPYVEGRYNGVDNVRYTKGGKDVDIRSMFTSKTVVYPLNTHQVYLPRDTVTASFKGDTDFAGLRVEFRLLKGVVGDWKNAYNDALNADLAGLKNIAQNPVIPAIPADLDSNGDAQVIFEAPAAGDYVLAVVSESTNPGTYDLWIFSMTPVKVLDYPLAITKPSSVDQGDSISVGFTMTATQSPTSYRYGAVIIRGSVYRAIAELTTDGILSNADLFVNGVLIAEGVGTIQAGGGINFVGFDLDDVDTGVVANKISAIFGSSNVAIAFSNPTSSPTGTVSLTTDSGMPTGTYVLLTGVWEQGTGKKLVAFKQSTVEISAAAPPSPPNKPPIANAGPAKTAVVGDPVSFDGSASNDPDGIIVSYSWDFGDGSTGTGITVSHTYTAAGTYTVTLTVNDDLGATGTATTTATARTRAQFTLSNLSVTPAQVNVGGTVTVQVAVKNIGDLEGTTTVDLLVNGVKEQSKSVTLAGGASATVSFSVTKTTAGSYTVKVGDLTGSFTVVKPPTPAAFTFTGLVVSPVEVKPGDEVTVSVIVKNTGEQSGTYSAELKMDGVTKETKAGVLAGGASTTVTFKVSSQIEGTHTVQVGDLTVSFKVMKPVPPTLPDYTMWIVAAVVAVAVVAAAVWYMRRKK